MCGTVEQARMIARVFLRRFSLLSRSRALPLRGGVPEGPGTVSMESGK